MQRATSLGNDLEALQAKFDSSKQVWEFEAERLKSLAEKYPTVEQERDAAVRQANETRTTLESECAKLKARGKAQEELLHAVREQLEDLQSKYKRDVAKLRKIAKRAIAERHEAVRERDAALQTKHQELDAQHQAEVDTLRKQLVASKTSLRQMKHKARVSNTETNEVVEGLRFQLKASEFNHQMELQLRDSEVRRQARPRPTSADKGGHRSSSHRHHHRRRSSSSRGKHERRSASLSPHRRRRREPLHELLDDPLGWDRPQPPPDLGPSSQASLEHHQDEFDR